MNAFRLKDGYKTAAGECVSLAALYAAAAFIVCGIPLQDIYMILTPLHSQNFLDVQDGILTNNRRLVTRTMWFNGTETSEKAQRALRNENVTIVAHSSGYVHCLYRDATIDKKIYQHFIERLGSYLSAELTLEVFASFLRSHPQYQKYFQLCRDCHGQPKFLRAEVLFHYEHGSDYKIGCKTHDKLLAEVSDDDFAPYELSGRIRCEQVDQFIKNQKVDVRNPQGRAALQKFIEPVITDAGQFIGRLADFVHIEAKLPFLDKRFSPREPIQISTEHTREQIIEYLQAIRGSSPVADLAFYAYRDMESCDWTPFIKAAVERSPVSLRMAESMSVEQVFAWLGQMKNASIYDAKRLAQPDEVANYRTGDGLEKAFLLASIIRQREPQQDIEIIADNSNVVLKGAQQYQFTSDKGLKKHVRISRDGTIST
jgi:hypothetical protein